MSSTFAIFTFGCKVNSYESEALKEKLISAGFAYREEGGADYILVNTCAVTLTAEKKDMEKIRSLRRNFPQSQIIVLGCFSQLHPERLEGLQGLKGIFGTSKRADILALIQGLEQQREKVDKNSRKFAYEELEIASFSSEIRAFVKIQDGCDNFCSYCVIPLVRGISRSRKKSEILQEVKRLALNGYKEIVLIGIDTGSYKDEDGSDFTSLVKDILAIRPQTFRLRISSIEESQVHDGLLDIMKTNPRLVPHLHIPLQSGSERILKLMKRKYDLSSFLALCQKARKEIPHMALSTDIIVGFPSETQEDFQKTCAFAEEAGFMRLHVFPYSRRPYTAANAMKEQIRPEVKKERVRLLVAEGKTLAENYKKSLAGEKVFVLLEEELKGTLGQRIFRGYSENYLDLSLSSEENLLGKMAEATLGPSGEVLSYRIVG
jgi:threonylcarbamoyladenosine tRNA methylthiotransferase MtaB